MEDNPETAPNVGERRVSNEKSSREYGVIQLLSATQLIAAESVSCEIVLDAPLSGIGEQVVYCFNNPPFRQPLTIPAMTSNISLTTTQGSDSGAAEIERILPARRQTPCSVQLVNNVAAATTSQTNEDGSSTQKKGEFKLVQPSQTHTTKTGGEPASTAAKGASKRKPDASDWDSEHGSPSPAQGPKRKIIQLETKKATSDCPQTESTNEQKSTGRKENIATVGPAQEKTEAPVKRRDNSKYLEFNSGDNANSKSEHKMK